MRKASTYARIAGIRKKDDLLAQSWSQRMAAQADGKSFTQYTKSFDEQD